jgi:hypothetical protein
MDNVAIPQKTKVKYLGMHLDMGKAHQNKKETAQPKSETKDWILRRSTLSIESKHLPYKAVLKPIRVWTYGIHLWGTTSNSNIEILQRFQSKTLRSIVNSPWYIKKHRIHEDLQMNTVISEINNGIPNTYVD